jgi:hypothetical protein
MLAGCSRKVGIASIVTRNGARMGALPRRPAPLYIGSRFARAYDRKPRVSPATRVTLAQTGVEGGRGSLPDGGYGKNRLNLRCVMGGRETPAACVVR